MSNSGRWIKTEDGCMYDYYRDTFGGRQYLTHLDGFWEVNQEGYHGLLHRDADQKEVLRIADEMATIDSLKIANMDAHEFCKSIYYAAASGIKGMISGDPERAEAGLQNVAQAEAYLWLLRGRLVDKTGNQSVAARAEEVSANTLRLINSFYGEKAFGSLDTAQHKLDAILEQVAEMQEELKEESGDPGRRS